MPDFSALLQKPAGEAKRPKALPIGDYPGVIVNWEAGDANRNKTPYVRFSVKLTDWPSEIGIDEREDVDISKRSSRCDFYLTDESVWRLDRFIRSCNVAPEGTTYAEVLPKLIGCPVIARVDHYLNQQTGEIGNVTRDITGLNGNK
jgi:hypothetical protein